jgi:hypothetical protein
MCKISSLETSITAGALPCFFEFAELADFPSPDLMAKLSVDGLPLPSGRRLGHNPSERSSNNNSTFNVAEKGF